MNEQKFKERLEHFLTIRTTKKGTINAMMQMQFVAYDVEEKSITLSFPIQAWQQNPAEHVHGGMLCTMLDMAMGSVAYCFSEATFTPTTQMSVNFVKGSSEPQVIEVKAICDHAGTRMIQTRAIANIQGDEGVIASANGSYMVNTKAIS